MLVVDMSNSDAAHDYSQQIPAKWTCHHFILQEGTAS